MDARSKLQAQVRCFEAGIDFVPIAPSQEISPVAAEQLLAESDLRDTVIGLQEKAQLTLVIDMPDRPKVESPSGRAWLLERQLHLSKKEQIVRQISEFAQDLTLEFTPLRQSKNRMQCNMLVARRRAHEVIRAIALGLRHLPHLEEVKLAITGPWPPYDFTTSKQFA
ncbi:GvpL/GvpF family gas vesicle protein [Cognatiyoonia sp. IB215182]|uniref:GvpL/GvpF family gas vesicle protein n=1 Tax=Cognatiyoonia sp. IB215182 TaxID=3097353 RepID=UPI002A16D0EB|nr:GvpL/GvpF family gas vesicle protein [Cognatiyoonia sp. IB215182]MDX8351417.1 GvpL/GvpF family gas vesicle protein [Cognatiyoonia sp. IB215182]